MSKNESYYCTCFTVGDLSPEDRASLTHYKAAVLKNARWQSTEQITIRFLEGDLGLQHRVKNVAEEWLQYANLSFDFRQQAPTDIRIAFRPGAGSWSYLGKFCRQIEEPNPTMNYGWLIPESPVEEVRRVVLHEFGHAIGLIHEHQNPKGGIKWNEAAVRHDLGGPPNNWGNATIQNAVFKFYPPADLIMTDLDPKSIMMYPIPRSWTLDGFSAGLNAELSDNDKVLVSSIYPR